MLVLGVIFVLVGLVAVVLAVQAIRDAEGSDDGNLGGYVFVAAIGFIFVVLGAVGCSSPLFQHHHAVSAPSSRPTSPLR